MEYRPGIWNHVSMMVIESEPELEPELEPASESEPRLLPKVMEPLYFRDDEEV